MRVSYKVVCEPRCQRCRWTCPENVIFPVCYRLVSLLQSTVISIVLISDSSSRVCVLKTRRNHSSDYLDCLDLLYFMLIYLISFTYLRKSLLRVRCLLGTQTLENLAFVCLFTLVRVLLRCSLFILHHPSIIIIISAVVYYIFPIVSHFLEYLLYSASLISISLFIWLKIASHSYGWLSHSGYASSLTYLQLRDSGQLPMMYNFHQNIVARCYQCALALLLLSDPHTDYQLFWNTHNNENVRCLDNILILHTILITYGN